MWIEYNMDSQWVMDPEFLPPRGNGHYGWPECCNNCHLLYEVLIVFVCVYLEKLMLTDQKCNVELQPELA